MSAYLQNVYAFMILICMIAAACYVLDQVNVWWQGVKLEREKYREALDEIASKHGEYGCYGCHGKSHCKLDLKLPCVDAIDAGITLAVKENEKEKP